MSPAIDTSTRSTVTGQTSTRLLSAAELAAELGFSREWVYDHASELGAIPMGDGPRPRLRFDLARTRALVARSRSERSQQPATPAPARRAPARGGPPTGHQCQIVPLLSPDQLAEGDDA
jgi:predicted DNA-binding transcriptional regulator AlpA